MKNEMVEITGKTVVKKSKCSRFYHNFRIFLPPFLIFMLVFLIYLNYYIFYLHPLITNKYFTSLESSISQGNSPKNTYIKGLTLLIITAFLFLILVISLLRTIFTDPGYFPSPTDFEFKVIKKNLYIVENCMTKKLEYDEFGQIPYDSDFNFLVDFPKVCDNYPSTWNEFSQLKYNIDSFMNSEIKINKYDENKNSQNQADNGMSYEEAFLNKEISVKNPKQIDFVNVFENFRGLNLKSLPLCNSCYRWKIERSHHCRQCNKCVLKMDHHCPWLSNCIGFRNFKYFCLVHNYGIILSSIILATFWEPIYIYFIHNQHDVFYSSYFTFIYLCNIGLIVFLGWLFYFNWILVLNGETIIEQIDRERFPNSKILNVYDLGKYENFTTVYGKNPLVWFLPIFPNYEGEGIVFSKISRNKK